MLKSELEALVAQQQARIAELEAQVSEAPDAQVHGYLVFAGNAAEAEGGWGDYRQCFAGEGEAASYARALISDPASIGLFPRPYDWVHVVELPTGRVIEVAVD